MTKKTAAIINNELTEYPEKVVDAISTLFQEFGFRLTFDEDNADVIVECVKDNNDYRITLWIDQDLL